MNWQKSIKMFIYYHQLNFNMREIFAYLKCLILFVCIPTFAQEPVTESCSIIRERISINKGWRFYKYDVSVTADSLIYDIRPEITDRRDDRVADARPTEAVEVEATAEVLKPWILPAGNYFIKDPVKHHIRPEGDPGSDFLFVQSDFDDSSWESVDLPHDWAIEGPFLQGQNAEVGGGMGRLPSPGIAWYRRKIEVAALDTVRSIFLEDWKSYFPILNNTRFRKRIKAI